jgi:glyoxylase-like metal-dependent hydrolase (beta-lactamase superfamily II)
MSLVNEALRLGPLENNSYLITVPGTGETAVVDAGFEPEAVIQRVRERRLTVKLLLNTHAHYDHVAGMRAVQQACGGVHYLHPADRPLLAVLSQQGAMFGFPPAEPPDETFDLADGQDVPLGDERLHVIHTPGHSPGGVCFHWNGDLWVGDTLFAGSVGRTDLPGGSFAALAHSIRARLFPLGDAVRVHTGHGEPTTIGDERRHNPFVGLEANFA